MFVKIEKQLRKAAWIIRSDIRYNTKEIDCTLEYIIVDIYSEKDISELTVVNVYDPPNNTSNKDEYTKIFSLTGKVIVVGDFNAHNTMWKSDKSDIRGLCIEEMIEKFNFVSLNNGTPTYQKANGGMSVLDLSFASNTLANKCEWAIAENSTWGSDHVACVTKVNENIITENEIIPRWNLKNVNWSLYS